MNKPAEHSPDKAVDRVQQRLIGYACDLKYDDLPPEVVHAAKVRVIDALALAVGGFFDEPCRVARNVAARMPDPNGATVIGTRLKTSPDMAAFVNATTVASTGMTDSYQQPGADNGHATETVTPVLAAAEHAQSSGRELITAVVLAYEVFLRFSDIFTNQGFDQTNFGCAANALAAGKLWRLSAEQLAHCISMAVVPNNILRQVKKDHISMFKAVAAGQAARAALFAAALARAGMEGPHLPFEGKAGWCDHVARKRFSFDALGGSGVPFRILQTMIKTRPADGKTISCILAAEKVAPINIRDVKQVIVETYKKARESGGIAQLHLAPASRQDADQSIYYVVAATLMDGTLTLRSFDDAHLNNLELRTLMQKIEVVENTEFTRAYEKPKAEHRTRVTVVTSSGDRRIGESGSDEDNLSTPKSDQQIEQKFRGFAQEVLDTEQINKILERLWHLEKIENVAEIPPALVFV